MDLIDVWGEAKIASDWESSADGSDKSPSVYSSTRTAQGVIFNRVYWSFTMSVSLPSAPQSV